MTPVSHPAPSGPAAPPAPISGPAGSAAAGSGNGKGARITAVTSGKGGVGKTFVTANLAAALARRGERVLVLDADLGLANIDVVLNLYSRLTLHDVFTGRTPLDDAILPAPGGFSVLLAGSGLVEYSRMTPEVRDKLLEVIGRVRPRYDHILLDTGAGISDVVLFTVSLADEVLIVATPEPTSLADAAAQNDPLLIFPNPSSGQFTLQDFTCSAAAIALVYDAQGKLVKRFSPAQNRTVDLSGEAAGIYLLLIVDDGTLRNARLVKGN
jgi:Mrp family chromosome partitioning ATPase